MKKKKRKMKKENEKEKTGKLKSLKKKLIVTLSLMQSLSTILINQKCKLKYKLQNLFVQLSNQLSCNCKLYHISEYFFME